MNSGLNQAMHLPDETREMTLCGRTWQTYLLSPGEAYPICGDCWAVQQHGGVAVPDPLTLPPKVAALPGERPVIPRRVEPPIKAVATRLDLEPKEN